MKIIGLELFTLDIENQYKYYSETLGFESKRLDSDSFMLKTGWTELIFKKSKREHLYHYCFLIPCNQLAEAFEWINEKVEIIEIEPDRHIEYFEDWNAESFYFKDPAENILEFIVHFDLMNVEGKKFGPSMISGICEIGLPSLNIGKVNSVLENGLGSKFWKGDFDRFGTNGSPEGKFLLPNYSIKKTWFPTEQLISPEPFIARVENNDQIANVFFNGDKIKTSINRET